MSEEEHRVAPPTREEVIAGLLERADRLHERAVDETDVDRRMALQDEEAKLRRKARELKERE